MVDVDVTLDDELRVPAFVSGYGMWSCLWVLVDRFNFPFPAPHSNALPGSLTMRPCSV